MISGPLQTILHRTYSRSDFAYRVSLIRELLEYTFYTKHDSSVRSDTIDSFFTQSKRSTADSSFIRALPSSFFEIFEPENFYKTLDTLTNESKQMQSFPLTVPVAFTQADVDVIGAWVRQAIAPDALIDIDIDPHVGAGCRFVWDNQRHDYSFNHYFDEKRTLLAQKLFRSRADVIPA